MLRQATRGVMQRNPRRAANAGQRTAAPKRPATLQAAAREDASLFVPSKPAQAGLEPRHSARSAGGVGTRTPGAPHPLNATAT